MKPDAQDKFRGPFRPIETSTSGIQICEHLPLLAKRSDKWALCRSLTHPFNGHSKGHMVMLSGRSDMPVGFNNSKPRREDWPSLASLAGAATTGTGVLPSSMVLPEKLVHRSGRVIPGQFGGLMGPHRDPWFLQASAFESKSYGAYPEYNFHHQRGGEKRSNEGFAVPQLTLPESLTSTQLKKRLELLTIVRQQQTQLEESASSQSFGRYYDMAVNLLTDSKVHDAFDIKKSDPALLERYGKNSFGWSLLMARRLVEFGVRLVQVNLGNNESWDTHTNAFHNLENFLLPPTDRAVSALLDDLAESGLLDDTLVVMAGEFGRTPKIFSIGTGHPPGRDHWGAVQTVWFAGGGVRGGTVVGSSDKDAGFPKEAPQKPENMAATVFEALGLPRDAHWLEQSGRPHPLYRAEPIPGLT